MFYWPTISAFFGITSNFFFLSIVALFSWLALVTSSKTELQKTTTKGKVSTDDDDQADGTGQYLVFGQYIRKLKGVKYVITRCLPIIEW